MWLKGCSSSSINTKVHKCSPWYTTFYSVREASKSQLVFLNVFPTPWSGIHLLAQQAGMFLNGPVSSSPRDSKRWMPETPSEWTLRTLSCLYHGCREQVPRAASDTAAVVSPGEGTGAFVLPCRVPGVSSPGKRSDEAIILDYSWGIQLQTMAGSAKGRFTRTVISHSLCGMLSVPFPSGPSTSTSSPRQSAWLWGMGLNDTLRFPVARF